MFNYKEADRVANVVSELVQSGSIRLEDIGIITPYREQVSKHYFIVITQDSLA